MGLLAQPRDSDMARKPTSPLGGGGGEERSAFYKIYVLLGKMCLINACVGSPRGLCVTVVDVLCHGVIIKQIFKFPFEIRTKSVHQART